MKIYPDAICTSISLSILTLLLLVCPSPLRAQGVASSIVISQVYGGGGNQGAVLTNDFVELFNRGDFTIDITGWTVQYASASGENWQRTDLEGSDELPVVRTQNGGFLHKSPNDE